MRKQLSTPWWFSAANFFTLSGNIFFDLFKFYSHVYYWVGIELYLVHVVMRWPHLEAGIDPLGDPVVFIYVQSQAANFILLAGALRDIVLQGFIDPLATVFWPDIDSLNPPE